MRERIEEIGGRLKPQPGAFREVRDGPFAIAVRGADAARLISSSGTSFNRS